MNDIQTMLSKFAEEVGKATKLMVDESIAALRNEVKDIARHEASKTVESNASILASGDEFQALKKSISELPEAFSQQDIDAAIEKHISPIKESINEINDYLDEVKASIKKIGLSSDNDEKINEITRKIEDMGAAIEDSLDSAKTHAENLLMGAKIAASADMDKALSDLISKSEKDLSQKVEEMRKGIIIPEAENGKDALQVEILPFIDESKSYPRGTYASHDGGLFRAFQKTSGMHGWECVINGVKSVDTVIDGKKASLVVTLSDGTSKSASSTVPVPEYKGIYRRGEVYAAKDMATWGGSVWIATKDVDATEEPGKCDAWQLMVKRGGDGRGLYAIAKDNGFKGTEKDLYEQITNGKQHQNIVRLKNGDN